MNSLRVFYRIVSSVIVLGMITAPVQVSAYEENNEFLPGAFPKEVKMEHFAIPLDPEELMVVYPPVIESRVDDLQALFSAKCGETIPFRNADELTESDISARHLIILGNISNNRRALELYKRRFAFADASFPGEGGVIVHPSASIWSPDHNVLVIGVSNDKDIIGGFKTFVRLLEKGAKTIGTMHHLSTSLKFPEPPEQVDTIFERVRNNPETVMAPYGTIANWGLCYYLSGKTSWAEYFRDSMYLCYEQGEKNGKWVTENWTNLYFNLWKMIYVWELLDDDPFFTPEDHRIIEEVLWGFTRFVRWLPNLDQGNAPLNECRQNHTTFLALSLYYAHRYYTEKYGITGLDSMVEKYRLAFDRGQAHSYRPNDDAGGYLNYGPLHLLTYQMAEGNYSFCESGRLKTFTDLIVATIDNRGDPVSFGDVGGYVHRKKGSPRSREMRWLSMAAWYYGDGRYQWVYNWGSRDKAFSFRELYSGAYAVDIAQEPPDRFLGIFPVMLDEGALCWSARRTEKKSHLPHATEKYLDKLSFRKSFYPQNEYMLLDGTSTFAHGHHDGNTISRLTWKNRIWLFDADYIKLTPKYHNGVAVTRDGIQDDPPPLTVLDFAADFDKYGLSRTTSRDYSGTDWERNIIWSKGRYFLFIDRITASEKANFRLESRWRTRGEIDLSGNSLTVRQGDKTFYIKSADDAFRHIVIEPDGATSRWKYPYGNGLMSICHARKNITMTPGDDWIFANLMYVVDNSTALPRELYKISDGLYMVSDSETREVVGLHPDVLSNDGVYTDCGLFVLDSRRIWFLDATYLRFRDVSIEAPAKVHLEINFFKRTGKLVVPEKSTGTFRIQNLDFKDIYSPRDKKKDSVKLGSGTYNFTFKFTYKGDFWKNRVPLISRAAAARSIFPGSVSDKLDNFGIDIQKKHEVDDSITAFCPDGNGLIAGDTEGRVTRFDGIDLNVIFRIPSERPVVCIHSADVDGDGAREIIAGDDNENIYCFEASGKELWSHKMTRFYGSDACAVDITVGDIDSTGKQTVLVATGGWKLYAFNPDGSVKWESFIYYHPLTRVRIMKSSNGKNYIAVGTEYHTPLNIVSPMDGKVIWKVWEEIGSEYLSTTEYCGYHLTDMVFMDTDGDGEREIVFGTRSNRIYALDASNGAMKWEANAGGEVTGLEKFLSSRDGTGRLLAGTDAGDLSLYDCAGQRLRSLSLGNGISDVQVIPVTGQDRIDIIAATEDGRLVICDENLLIRASRFLENTSIKGIVPGVMSNGEYTFHVVSDRSIYLMKYHPSYLKKSRYY